MKVSRTEHRTNEEVLQMIETESEIMDTLRSRQKTWIGHNHMLKKKKKNLFFAQKPNITMNKHVNKVRKATGRAEAITAGRRQNRQQLIDLET